MHRKLTAHYRDQSSSTTTISLNIRSSSPPSSSTTFPSTLHLLSQPLPIARNQLDTARQPHQSPTHFATSSINHQLIHLPSLRYPLPLPTPSTTFTPTDPTNFSPTPPINSPTPRQNKTSNLFTTPSLACPTPTNQPTCNPSHSPQPTPRHRYQQLIRPSSRYLA